MSAQEVAPALGIRYRFGGIAGLWSCGRSAYRVKSTGPRACSRCAFSEPFRSREKKVPKMDAGVLCRSSSQSMASGACSRSRIRPSARVSHVVTSTVTCRPFIGAPKDSRALPPRSRAVWSLYREKSTTRTRSWGLARAASQAVWKAMNVLPTPPRLLQKHTVCLGDMAPGFAAGRGARARGRVIGLTPDWRVFFSLGTPAVRRQK